MLPEKLSSMEYTQGEQDEALKVLKNLVKENQQLRNELSKAQEFCLRLLVADNFERSEKNFSFTDNALIDYQEDWEEIIPYFFFNFYPNSNANKLPDGTYQSDFSVTIKDGTQFPSIGTIEQVREKVSELNKRFSS